MSREDQEVKSEAAAEVPEPATEVVAEVDPAGPERDRLQAELAEVQDRLLRTRAEFENFRRRTDKDRSEFLQYAGSEVVREILPVLDDFERALKTTPAGDASEAGFRKGVELIYQRLTDTLKKIGLEPVEIPAGTPFDPNLHQAVGRVETTDAEDNTVLDEFQRGYNFKGKLLRPAMVRVAVKPAS